MEHFKLNKICRRYSLGCKFNYYLYPLLTYMYENAYLYKLVLENIFQTGNKSMFPCIMLLHI